MNYKVNWTSALNIFYTVLDSTTIETQFRQMFYVTFCAKCNWNFGDFSKINITFYKHISNINNGDNGK